MSLLESVVLGIVQGITEFLPISSSGHLILAREVLNLQSADGLAVDAVLQLATALAVVLYFRKDLMVLAQSGWNLVRGRVVGTEQRTLLFALGIGTVPAVIAGMYLERTMDTVFRNPHLVAWVLLAGSVLLVLAEYVRNHYHEERTLTIQKGIVIGFFQTLALIPGMSRSGATISGGMLLGLSRESAARFAFLLSVPIILGSGAKKLLELGGAGTPGSEWGMIGIAALVAFVSGLAAIHFLLTFLKNHTLYGFAVYRVALAILVFVLL